MKNNLPYYFNLYLNEYLSIQKNVSKHTLLSYKYTFNGFLLFCVHIKNISINNISLNTFNNEMISQFLTYLEETKHNSTATRNNKLKNIKSFLKFVYPHESSRMLQIQDVLNIPLKKDIDRPVEYMTVDVLKILLEQPKTETVNGRRDLTLLATLYDTGARVSELVNLKVRDVKFDKTITTIRLFGKGSKVRIVPIIGNTSNLLSKYFKDIADARMKMDKEKIKIVTSYKANTLTGMPEKYEKPTEKCEELIIVEGDSAGGSVKQGRNEKIQGVFPIRGKIPSAFEKTKQAFWDNAETQGIARIILKKDYTRNFDPEKDVEWKKIIFMADADVDQLERSKNAFRKTMRVIYFNK